MLRRDRWMKKLWLTDWLTELTEGKVLSSFLLWWAFHLTLLWPSSLILSFLSDSSTKLHSLSSVSLSGGVSPIVGVDTGLTWDEHAFYPRKWCFVLTSESLWPYQQWNACDKSHWESALEKWASVCKTISIYPQRSPLFFFFFFFNVSLLSRWRSPNEVPWMDTCGFCFERCPVSHCGPGATLF